MKATNVQDKRFTQAVRNLNALRERAAGLPGEDLLIAESLEELGVALEELRVTSEQLREQNAELIATRAVVEAERRRYQELFELAPDGYLVTDALGVIREANRAAQALLRKRRDFLVGKPLSVFVASEDRLAFRDLISRLEGGAVLHDQEVRLQPAEGVLVPVGLHVTPSRDRQSRVVGLQWILHDFTARKREEERLRQAERLAAVGEMVAGLAHESRNALQRSQAGLERLALRVQDQPDALALINEIQQAQDHLHLLYSEVRTYAGPTRLEPRACNLADLWREAWAHLESLHCGRDALLREETDGQVCDCCVDPFRLRQVFRNILENSLAACPDPVRITITCSRAELADRQAVRITVRDNGPGLSPEQHARIFEPFYTTKTRGTGLGMAIAKRIVEAHGGRIEANAERGQGAAIVVTLPRS
jgi:PAS domain S-box-containing protein